MTGEYLSILSEFARPNDDDDDGDDDDMTVYLVKKRIEDTRTQ